MVFDCTSRESFDNISRWIEEGQRNASQNLLMMLISNKSDLADTRQVSTDEAAAFAKEKGMLFIETSAKTGVNVQESFNVVASEILRKVENGDYNLENENCGIKVGNAAYKEKQVQLSLSGEKEHKRRCRC